MILFLNNFFATLILRVFTLGKIRKFDESILEKKNFSNVKWHLEQNLRPENMPVVASRLIQPRRRQSV